MSKHNYSQYSNKNNQQNQNNRPRAISQEEVEKKYTPIVPAEPVKVEPTPNIAQSKPMAVPAFTPDQSVANLVQETVETVSLPDTVEGMVVNCAKLNVRENATVDSDIVCVLDSMSEIQVDVNKSTTKWAYVYTATGREGYCMRQYIEARL